MILKLGPCTQMADFMHLFWGQFMNWRISCCQVKLVSDLPEIQINLLRMEKPPKWQSHSTTRKSNSLSRTLFKHGRCDFHDTSCEEKYGRKCVFPESGGGLQTRPYLAQRGGCGQLWGAFVDGLTDWLLLLLLLLLASLRHGAHCYRRAHEPSLPLGEV